MQSCCEKDGQINIVVFGVLASYCCSAALSTFCLLEYNGEPILRQEHTRIGEGSSKFTLFVFMLGLPSACKLLLLSWYKSTPVISGLASVRVGSWADLWQLEAFQPAGEMDYYLFTWLARLTYWLGFLIYA